MENLKIRKTRKPRTHSLPRHILHRITGFSGIRNLLFLFLLLTTTSLQAQWATITNGNMWRDHKGNDVQAHAAGFLKVKDTWYMIGEDRTNTWRPDVNMYSSKDLVNWKFERKIIQNGVSHPDLGGDRMIERPKLLYCAKTGKFVVWMHWEAGNYGASEAAVFYCDSVNGPYKFHWAGRPMGIKSRDCNVFVDDDGTAYFISTTEENQHLGLFRLSDDYLSVVSHTQLFAWQRREAPAIVRIDDTYYMISSACTGWDSNQAKLAKSKSLTSGWSGLSDIGNANSFDTQAASILKIQGTEGTTYVYVGDRWQDPDLFESKTILFPIEFKNGSMTFNYTRQWDLDMEKGTWRVTPRENFIPKANWKLQYVSSQETASENGKATNAFDGNPNTIWHTKYSGSTDAHPHDMRVDMGAEYEVSGFLYTPRQDKSTNGTLRNFQLYLSKDGKNWGTPVAGGWMTWQSEITFSPAKARYFRLVALSEYSGGKYASAAEIDLIRHTADSPVLTPSALTPYSKVDNGGWTNATRLTVQKGGSVSFGPQCKGRGSWSWQGPNGLTGSQREITISNIDYAQAGTYTVLFLNQYNCISKAEIEVTVTVDEATAKEYARKRLQREVDKANTILVEELPGGKTLKGIIALVTNRLNTPSYTSSQLENSLQTLRNAENRFFSENRSTGIDRSSLIDPDDFMITQLGGSAGITTLPGSGCAAFYSQPFIYDQTLRNLENGYYMIGVQGFYRDGKNDGSKAYRNGSEELHAQLLANEKAVSLQSLYDMPYSGENALNGYCDDLEGADLLFNEDEANYANWLITRIEDGTLAIALKKTDTVADDWCAFNHFRLYYLGGPTDLYSPFADAERSHAIFSIDGLYMGTGDPESFDLKPGIYLQDGKKFMK